MEKDSRHTLKAQERLKSKVLIDRLFKEGNSLFVHPIKLLYLRITDAETTHPFLFSVSIPKRNHRKAHVRNLLKRKVREAYRLNKPNPVMLNGHVQPFALMYILVDRNVTDTSIIRNAIDRLHQKFAKTTSK